MIRISLQPSYILHARPYRDTSLLLDVFSRMHGRVHLLARGAKNKNKSACVLQPFSPLLLSWQGRTELMNLSHREPLGSPLFLERDALLCGFYLNELLVRVLQRNDAYPHLYDIYETTLKYLAQSVNIPCVLRLFEKHLLIEIGYALSLDQDLQGHSLCPEKKYRFISSVGFECVNPTKEGGTIFLGQSLIALREERFQSQTELHEVKRLMQLALMPILGDKPLKSRTCFV